MSTLEIGVRYPKKAGTLIVRRIINLTSTELLVYDRTGDLVDLPPEDLHLRKNSALPIIGDSTFIIVDDSTDKAILKMLEQDREYQRKLAMPHPIGEAKDGRQVYRLMSTGYLGRPFFVTPATSLVHYAGRMVAW